MKYLRLVLLAFLMAVCGIQVQVEGIPYETDLNIEDLGWEWMTPPSSPTSHENNQRHVRIPAARPGGTWIEITPTRVLFHKRNHFADDINPGLSPNTRETLDDYASALSGVNPESLLRSMGLNEVPQTHAIPKVLGGLLLGRVRLSPTGGPLINARTATMFFRMLKDYGQETVLAMAGIVTIITDVYKLRAERSQGHANDVLETAVTGYNTLARDPIPMQAWSEMAPHIDQLMAGSVDASRKIITIMASNCRDLQRLIRLTHAEQATIVRTVIEDVANFSKFLSFVKYVRRLRGE